LAELKQWLPSESSQPSGFYDADNINIACDSVDDVVVYLVNHGEWGKLFVHVCCSVAVLVTIALASFYLGSRVKARAPWYWTNRTYNPWSDDFEAEVDVTKELQDSVQRLLDVTTIKEFMGQGRDGAWATHRGLKVIKVTRIENGRLWSAYAKTKMGVAPLARTMRDGITMDELLPEDRASHRCSSFGPSERPARAELLKFFGP